MGIQIRKELRKFNKSANNLNVAQSGSGCVGKGYDVNGINFHLCSRLLAENTLPLQFSPKGMQKSVKSKKHCLLKGVLAAVCVSVVVVVGVGVRACGLKMDNKKLIATNSCAIFSVRLETVHR